MDPNANLTEQIQLAKAIIKQWDAERSDKDQDILHDAARLAELVLALDEGLRKGGCLPSAWW